MDGLDFLGGVMLPLQFLKSFSSNDQPMAFAETLTACRDKVYRFNKLSAFLQG
jgi:hypothetical protein